MERFGAPFQSPFSQNPQLTENASSLSLSLLLKPESDLCPAPGLTVHLNRCAMELGGMLDDRKTKACAPDLSGVALVDAVEPLEDALLFLTGDAYACVFYADAGLPFFSPDAHEDFAVFPVVFDGIVTEVKEHLLDQMLRPQDADR